MRSRAVLISLGLGALWVLPSRAAPDADDEIIAVVGLDVPGQIRRVKEQMEFSWTADEVDLARRERLARSEEAITRRDLARRVGELASHAGDGPLPIPEKMERHRALARRALEELIDSRILLRAAREQGFDIPDSEVEDEMLKEMYARKMQSFPEYARLLADHGLTLEDMRKRIRDDIWVHTYIRYNIRLFGISPREVEEYYRDHPDEFAQPKEVKLRLILVGIPQRGEGREKAATRAAECLGKAASGADPALLAREYSEHLESRDQGGLLESRTLGSFPAEVEALAYGPDARGWLGPVEAKGFFWIFRVEERKESRRALLSEVQQRVQQTLERNQIERHRKALLDRLKRKFYVWRSPAVVGE